MNQTTPRGLAARATTGRAVPAAVVAAVSLATPVLAGSGRAAGPSGSGLSRT